MENLKRYELILIVKDMKIKGCANLKKKAPQPPSPPPPPPPEVLKEIERASLPELKQRAKEMGLQRYTLLKKKELVELIKNPIAPRVHKRGIKRKVSLTHIDESGECDTKLTFPSINQAAKYFGINSGVFGVKLNAKTEKARNSITINEKTYQLKIE